ncbi:hypothetical protein EI555_004433 [Monodon monoceros]|uniref:Large ribosomal subunit protein bL34m n=1 Tax=Monodon monoceros TaxID=40151 RepID=A0A4U1EEZ3_MONMO|nr:hypothetical protein EI555_004433 [Monodon monoceros]
MASGSSPAPGWVSPTPGGLPAVQKTRDKARGNEYQRGNIKRKNKHGWILRLSTPNCVQVILRRKHKGQKSLSHCGARRCRLDPPLKHFPR